MGVIGGRKPPHQEDMILYIDAASVFTHPLGTTTFNSMIKNGVVNTDVLTNDNAPTYVEAGHGSYLAFDGVDDALRWNNTGLSSTNEITEFSNKINKNPNQLFPTDKWGLPFLPHR